MAAWPRWARRGGRWASVAALEIGVAAAVTAGVTNWLRMGGRIAGEPEPARGDGEPAHDGPPLPRPRASDEDGDSGHMIYLDPWAGDTADGPPPAPSGPADLPGHRPGRT